MIVMPMTRAGVTPRTFQSFLATRWPDKDKRIIFCPTDRPTASARSDALRNAKEFKVESLLFVDSDMEWEPDAYRKLAYIKGDIVCGLFFNRSAPSYPTICRRQKSEDGKDQLVPIVPDGSVMDVDGCGMAFTLIRRPVIEAMDYPAFQHLGWLSEDYFFCLRAKEKGFSIRCDTSLLISHRGEIGFCGQPELAKPEAQALSYPFGVTRERESWKAS